MAFDEGFSLSDHTKSSVAAHQHSQSRGFQCPQAQHKVVLPCPRQGYPKSWEVLWKMLLHLNFPKQLVLVLCHGISGCPEGLQLQPRPPEPSCWWMKLSPSWLPLSEVTTIQTSLFSLPVPLIAGFETQRVKIQLVQFPRRAESPTASKLE